MATNARSGDGLNAAFSPVVPIPNLIEIQLASFRWFLEDGLRGLFRNFSPIKDFTETLELELVDYHLEQPKYSQDECRQRDMTYEAPIKVQVRLHSREDGVPREVVESEVYMGALPLMTEQGTFIINGAERVVVSQLARSPGVYFRDNIDYSGRTLFYATVIPSEGAWTDVETEVGDQITVRVGQTKKFPITTLLRALAGVADANVPTIVEVSLKEAEGRTAAKDIIDRATGEVVVSRNDVITAESAKRLKKAGITDRIDVYLQVPKAITDTQILELFGQHISVDATMTENLLGKFLLQDLKDAKDKVAVKAYKRIDQKMASDIQALVQGELEVLDVPRYISSTLEQDPIKGGEGIDEEKIIADALLDIYRKVRPGDPATVESARTLLRSIYYDVRRYDLARVGRYKLNKKLGHRVDLKIPALTRADLIAIMRYILRLSEGDETARVDDIDHLANKRVRSVGELLQNQLRLGFLRMEKVARERMTSVDAEHAIPQVILSVKPISASIKSFFGSSQLSQFMDQHNPLAELTHKRRLSALGPGGLSRQSAKLEVRDVHHSHYGRICPIETPEGPNIGLIGSMATYTHINEFGFLETPYYVAFEGTVFPFVVYLTADEEEDPLYAWEKVEQVIFGTAVPSYGRPGENSSKNFMSLIRAKRASTDIDALVAALQPDIQERQIELKEKQAELSKATKELTSHNRKIAELEKDAATLVKVAEKAQKALDNVEEKVKTATAKLKTGDVEHGEVDRLTGDRDDSRKEKATAQRKAEQAAGKIAALKGPRDEARRRQQAAERGRDKVQGELDRILTRKARLLEDKSHGWRVPGTDELSAWDVKIVPSGTPMHEGEDGTWSFTADAVQVRSRGRYPHHEKEEFAEPYSYRYMLVDISPMQVFSPATSLIPFLENDDANRALMGSNMQRQAVPVIKTDAPIVGTGLERKVAVDSGAVVIARRAGRVKSVTSERITIEVPVEVDEEAEAAIVKPAGAIALGDVLTVDMVGQEGEVIAEAGTPVTAEVAAAGGIELWTAPEPIAPEPTNGRRRRRKAFEYDTYRLENMRRSNQATCIRQVAIVKTGDKVKQGEPLADGPCTDQGRLALGQNLLVAFMTWGGYNYEDAIILSQRIVREDIFSSIHIEKYEVEARDTKLGPEEITRDIPNVSEDSLKDLDEYGIIRIGADVGPEDILVGKVAPKSQGEQSAEERLIIAIFGKKAEETRDVSLRVPHGEKGKIIDVKVFSRFKYECERCKSVFDYSKKPDRLLCDRCGGDLERLTGDELPAGVNQLVRVYIAQKRKIMEGDKMAGRHGNKGVISRILPLEEMPFLSDGTPVDIVLNPLGVPSRMNIGQVMETHLGFVGKVLGKKYDENIFRGDKEHAILAEIRTLVDHFRNRRLREYANMELELGLTADENTPVNDIVAELLQKVTDLPDEERKEMAARLAVGPQNPETVLVEQDAVSTTIHLSPAILADLDAVVTPQEIVDRIVQNVYKRVGINPDTGKAQVISGQTGEPYDSETMVGQVYMMKLLHLVEDKIHARSTGPYSLVTQQPLGGKAQFGGQRFGEMEVWALEAYGAAYTLQEILTIKSDDVLGRVKTYESIVKGDQIMEPGVPESFKILVNELQSLCLKVTVEDAADRPVDLRLQEDEQLDAVDRAGAPRLAQARYGGDM